MSDITTGVLAEDMDLENADDIPLDGSHSPTKTFESARRFLWDEDDEFEEDPYYTKGSNGTVRTLNTFNNGMQPKKSKGALFPLSLAPRFQSDRGDASPAMYGDADAEFPTVDIRSSLGTDFHRAYRKSFVQHRSSSGRVDRVSFMGGIFSSCIYYLCRPCVCISQVWKGASKKHKLLMLAAVVFVSLSIFGIIMAVTAASSSSSSSSSGEETSPPQTQPPQTQPPETQPPQTKAPQVIIDTERYEAIRTMILSSGLTTVDHLDQAGSAQNNAIKWLAEHDLAALDVGDNDDVLLERYVVATFFYSTYEIDSSNTRKEEEILTPHWNETRFWMTDKDVCKWHGIVCDSPRGPFVTDFNLTLNGVEGTIPSELAGLQGLKFLDLRGNAFKGTIPPALGELQDLHHLGLGDNNLTGTIPTEIGACKKLHVLQFDRNIELEGTIPTEFEELEYLHYFGVHWNKLTGPLLDATKLTNLRILEQGENQFTGTIPTEYGTLSHLVELRLRENQLEGTIPSEIGGLGNLEVLHYSHNELTGTLPTSIGGLTKLSDFRFQHNELSGPLPTEIGLMTSLENLNLEDNEFTGTLPWQMKHLKLLHSFRFFRNDFSGTVPKAFCEDNRKTPFKELAGDCSDKDPKIECSCCSQCDGFK